MKISLKQLGATLLSISMMGSVALGQTSTMTEAKAVRSLTNIEGIVRKEAKNLVDLEVASLVNACAQMGRSFSSSPCRIIS